MKKLYTLASLLIFNTSFSQMSTEGVVISETYSSNGEYELKSICYDNEVPNLKGESFVTYVNEYERSGVRKSYYKINRSFDLFEGSPYFVALSNDGRKIVYIKNVVYYDGDEHKNVTYYVDGKLIKTFDTNEFISCNDDAEKCEMFYDNTYDIYNYRLSNSTVRVYKEGLSEKEKFLSKNYVFNRNDTIYVIDSRKKVTLFDLNNNKFINSKIEFDSIYPKIKNYEAVRSKIQYYKYPFKYITDIENSNDNKKLSESISEISNLKFISIKDSTLYKYKLHKIELAGYLDKKGRLEIETFNADSIFDVSKIREYLQSTTFKTDFIPDEVDKIYVTSFFGGYRSFDDKIAKQETIKEKERRKEEFKRRLTLEKIDGIYIPKNLYEAITELDKLLDFASKKQMKEATQVWEFNSHIGGLGMWIRNNWGINGGSWLLKYFNDRKIGTRTFGNEEISGVITEQYIKWLKGDKKSWEKWEKENPIKKH